MSTSLSHQFSSLTGRSVMFTRISASPDTNPRQIYGIYTAFPSGKAIVVKADAPLLGAFAGALVGLPDSEVRRHLNRNPMEELLRDAIYESLNIAASVVSGEGRAVFVGMSEVPATLGEIAVSILAKPEHKTCFEVKVAGYQGGGFTVLD
jgi:hypothetical protein